MIYRLEFTDDAEGRRRYELCYQAIALTPRQIAIGEWDDCVDLVRAMKQIGIDAGTKVQGIMLLDLVPGGGIATLSRASHKLLLDMVKQPLWRPDALEDVRSVHAWLDGLKEEAPAKEATHA